MAWKLLRKWALLRPGSDPVRTNAFVVHWRNPEACVRTLRALRAQTVPLAITVIDNGSPLQDWELLRSSLPGILAENGSGAHSGNVELVRSERNEGYGGALNRLLERWPTHDSSSCAIMCPHDALPRPDCVERILELMRSRPNVGLACAEYGDDRAPGYTLLRGYDLYPTTRSSGFCSVEFPNGTLFAVSRACLSAIGGFDTRYFAYGEEYDLGRRAREAGFEVDLVWGAVVENPSRVASSDTVWYLNLRNGLLASCLREGVGAAALRSVVTLIRGALEAARGVRGPTTPPFPVRARAVGDFWAHRFGPPTWPGWK